MSDVRPPRQRGGERDRTVRRVLARAGAASLAVIGLSGCEVDSFFDPSVAGRWEHTPARLPILERLSAIEDEHTDLVEPTEVVAEDLLPAPQAYRIGPGDALSITIYDFVNPGQPELIDRVVDVRGMIEIPQLGQILLSGRTVEQATQIVAAAMTRLVRDPLVSITVGGARQQTFNIIGSVEGPGTYQIPSPDYRVLEALTQAGQIPLATTESIYIIRQVSLSDEAMGVRPVSPAPAPGSQTPAPPPPEDIVDILDALAKPADQPPPAPAETPKEPPGSPGAVGAANVRGRPKRQPETQPPAPAIELPETDPVPAPRPSANQPAAADPTGAPAGGESSWVFIDGKWVKVFGPAPTGDAAADAVARAGMVTQRVIRVPLKRLLSGDATYNIIVRPGDVIHVPAVLEGLVYVEGQVARIGPVQLPAVGRMTLQQAIVAAGGLGTLAIPERVDLWRRIGTHTQAVIRVDLRAIKEGTQPDIYVRADDTINVGTNFWAVPLAVLRNGFRASYGFGLVIDRNFGNDIFGVPPSARTGF